MFCPVKLGSTLAVVSLLVSLGCASKETTQLQYGEIAPRGEKLLEITSRASDGFYRGAFEVCRSQQPPMGFKVVQPPAENKATGWGLTGLAHCEGDLDPTLTLRYQEKEKTSKFAFIKGPRSDRSYFEVRTKK